MAGSKSSQTVKNLVIVVLALWSVISLIIIVVWATSPGMKSATQCHTELQETNEKLEGAKVVYNKNKAALEEKVQDCWDNQTRLQAEIQALLLSLAAANASLDDCRQENVALNGNISTLQQQIELHRETELNLTAQIQLQKGEIEVLQVNVTQAFHQTQSCFSLNAAAENQKLAAQSQTEACKSSKQYLEKQLLKCKVPDQQVSPQTTENHASPLCSIPALLLLLCSSLHLIT